MNLEAYLQQHYTPSTAAIYQYEIGNYLANQPAAASAHYKDVLQYIGVLRTRYSNPATLNRILSSIKAWYNYQCYTGSRSDNPARSILLRDNRTRDIQLQDLFTTAELEALQYRQERYGPLGPRNKALMSLLIHQALHPAEIAALRLQSVDLHAGSIQVQPTAKTNKRTLSLKPAQIMLFYGYIEQTRKALLKGNKSDVLIVGLRGEPMQASDITKHIQRMYRGMYPGREVTAQTIRQSVIANLLKQGHDLSLVQYFAGHKYLSSTEKYKQSQVETLRSAINKYHPIQ